MSLLLVVVVCAAVFLVAYVLYGRLLVRLLKLDPQATVPAITQRDDLDYAPLAPGPLLNQHFAAIAAAGPIVGPILAGVWFGWLPALLWIVLGSIFIGGVHDFTALMASIRHKARSIAEVVRLYMTRRSYIVFLLFIWLALEYVVVAFTDMTAASFVGQLTLDDGTVVSGPGIATSSLLYLALPVIMGLLMRYTKLPLSLATLIFLPLVGVAIWAGQHVPLDLGAMLNLDDDQAHRVWDVFLLVYCFIASIVPMWLLLQPRGHLGGYFLFFALGGGMLGLIFGHHTVQYPAFTGWGTLEARPLFPLLFITVACGACSGFHAMVASGTTSKQLRCEPDARLVGYGAMLMEGMVAVMSLACVMMLAAQAPILTNLKPNFVYASGMGEFLKVFRIDPAFAVAFGLMAFTTFVYDTLDVCTRLGRYVMEELLGWHTLVGRIFATAVTAGTPLLFVMRQAVNAAGKPVPAWQVFWGLFGASNQLLAALTLIGVTVWLWRTRRAAWVWFVTGVPALVMYVISVAELVRMIAVSFRSRGITADPVPWVALLLIALAALIAIEAVKVLASRDTPPASRDPALAPVPA